MKNAIGNTFIYNIIIVFIVLIFAFLSGALSYYKAFKVNNRIVYIIEKYEGYNSLAKQEINRYLDTIGYSRDLRNLDCSSYKGTDTMTIIEDNSKEHRYCIYVDNSVANSRNYGNGTYYSYAVRTYLSIDLPLINLIRIPITTKTNQIYKFTSTPPITSFN